MRIIVVVLLAACSTSTTRNLKICACDALREFDAPFPICDPGLQTGCSPGQKCTWVTDEITPVPLGHVDCVMEGTVAIGGACTQGSPGSTTGFDNCFGDGYCWNGTCERICVPRNPATCSTKQSCATHPDTFVVYGNTVYGTCE